MNTPTYSEHLRETKPEVARKRDARSRILASVYGPALGTVRKGGVPFGLRDSMSRATGRTQRDTIRRYWRDAEWPRSTLDMVLADADMVFEDLVWETLD
jgi:hypothetical protein